MSNTDASALRLAIIGAGALGLSFAARLAPHCQLQLITRTPAQAEQLRRGVHIGDHIHRFAAHHASEASSAEWVLVLVKTPATAKAFADALSLRPRAIISLQNGLIEHGLSSAQTAQILIEQGVTTAGAWRDAEGGVHPSSCGETLLPPGAEALVALFNTAGLPARTCDDLAAARLSKLLVNLAINPLAALLQRRNGELLDGTAGELLETLVREAWPVLHRAGLPLDAAAALERVRSVARATASNRASMLQDVLAGRPSEIDAITGALLTLAAEQGQQLPTHAAIYQLIKALPLPVQR